MNAIIVKDKQFYNST